MERKDFIKLIKAAEGVMILEDACKVITGCNLDEGQCRSIYLLWEVIRDNSAERFSRHETIDIDNESYRAFVGILENRGMTAEEKYAELTK